MSVRSTSPMASRTSGSRFATSAAISAGVTFETSTATTNAITPERHGPRCHETSRTPFPARSSATDRETKRPRIAARPFRFLVEPRGIEPLTSRVRLWRRPTITRCCSAVCSALACQPSRNLRNGRRTFGQACAVKIRRALECRCERLLDRGREPKHDPLNGFRIALYLIGIVASSR